MTYLTDIQRVELALPARLMWNVVNAAWENKSDPEPAKMLELLKQASNDPLEGLDVASKAKVVRRIEATACFITKQFTKRDTTAAKVGMVFYYLLETLLQDGTMELFEGAPLAQAFEMFLPHLNTEFEKEALDRSAQKQAAKILESLHGAGFYLYPGTKNEPSDTENAST